MNTEQGVTSPEGIPEDPEVDRMADLIVSMSDIITAALEGDDDKACEIIHNMSEKEVLGLIIACNFVGLQAAAELLRARPVPGNKKGI
jgi:hypothetical protein